MNGPPAISTALLASSPAMAPSALFFGLILGKNRCRPQRVPTTMAAVSPAQTLTKTTITARNPV